jgi:hypothetical protein
MIMSRESVLNSFLILTIVLVPLLYTISQLIKGYAPTIIALLLYSMLASCLAASRQGKHLMFLLIMWSLSIWIVYYMVLSPSWILANGDLLLMSKVSEEIVSNGYYPFNNEYLLTTRPNYVLYPIPFMLQAILSIVTSIKVQILIYVSILMYAVYILIITLTLLLMKKVSSKFLPFVMLPILSFVSPQPIHFVYSHLSRAFLFLFLYVYMRSFLVGEKKVKASIITLTLLAVSSTLGHSQEPITFSIFLMLFIVMMFLIQHKIKRSGSSYLLIPGYIIILLVLIYNDYVAAYTFQGIVLFLKQILIDLLPESSINVVTQKTYIAQSVLQWWEFMLVVIGFVAMIFYVIIILLEHLIRALRIQKWHIIAFDFTIIVYGLMALLPLTMRGIGPDLFFRPLWTLFIALSILPMILISQEETSFHLRNYKQIKVFLAIMIVLTLFILSNSIYMRIHLVSSSVYTHEASTIDTILKSGLIKYLQSSEIEIFRAIIIDSPYQPAYEIGRALLYLIAGSRVEITILSIQPEVKEYVNLSYLNGLIKYREFISSNISMEEHIQASYVIASTYDDSPTYDILISKNVIFSFKNIIMAT